MTTQRLSPLAQRLTRVRLMLRKLALHLGLALQPLHFPFSLPHRALRLLLRTISLDLSLLRLQHMLPRGDDAVVIVPVLA